MGVLDQLAGQIYSGFRGKLRTGTLWRAVAAISAGLDAQGDPNATVPTTWPCQGFTDVYSAVFKARAGIPETDVMVGVFGASLPAGIVPQKDDKVFMIGQWFQVRKAATDPAFALWSCQSFVCRAPP